MSHDEGVAAVSLPSSPRCTRLVSWREPEPSGAHPRTKGARCFAGGRRRRSDATATGRLTARAACGQGTRRWASQKQDQCNPEDRGGRGTFTRERRARTLQKGGG